MKSCFRRSRWAIDRDDLNFDAAELARQLIESGALPPGGLTGEQRCTLAWTLKDACYAAWSSEPRRAADAADALRRLGESDANGAQAREIVALVAWTAGIAQVAQGRMADAMASFDLAADEFRALGQAQHAAETQVPKIMALSMLGQHAAAAECAERTQREFLAQQNLRAAARVSLNLGSLHMWQDAYTQAARCYREAAVLAARVGDSEHSVMADIGLADALTMTGDFDEAMRMYARARMRAEGRGFPVLCAKVDESVALLQLVRGNYRDALAGLERARRQYESLSLPQHLAVAEKLLADAYLELRLLPEALALFRQALGRFEALDMPREQAWTHAQLGRTHAMQGQPIVAIAALERASTLFIAQGNSVGAASVDLARAELAIADGRDDEAVRLAAHAAQGFQQAALADGSARADAVRAQALLHVGDVEQARALYDATLKSARTQQLLPVQLRCLTGAGLVAQAKSDTTAARAAFQAAIDLFEDQRRALPGDEIRSAFLADHLLPFRELLRMALDAHMRSATPDGAAQVLQQLERFRARTLAERMTQPVASGGDPDLQPLRRRLNWLYRRLRRAQDEASSPAALVEELRQTERELLERVRRHRLASNASRDSISFDNDLDVARLCQALGADGALIEYGVIDDELFACIATADGITVHRNLAGWRDTLQAIDSARFQIETLRFGATPVAKHLDSLRLRTEKRMRQLHARLWAPLQEALAPFRRIVVVPHGQLARLPFGALNDGERFLVETVELATAPSARIALHGCLRRASIPQRALALGESASLPHAEREARSVAGLFSDCTVFVGEQATTDALRAHAGAAEVIHLACHAQFRGDNPMFSALHLHDGALTAEEVEQLTLRPGIVVLSACETGLGDSGDGDEMVGLVRAFLLAGAARIIASLWPIDDATTAEFMTHFYAALRRGCSPSRSLSLSQNALREQHRHPYFWAGFTLFGGW